MEDCYLGSFPFPSYPLYQSLPYAVSNPMKVRASLQLQGVTGPPSQILLCNILEVKNLMNKANMEGGTTEHGQFSHDYEAKVFPFTKKWRDEYGNLFTFALGTIQCFYVGDPDMVKEISTCTSLDFGKPSNLLKTLSPLLGQGILNSNSELWLRQRKVITPIENNRKAWALEKEIHNLILAGYETTAVTATWCAMFLAVHQDWQSRIRAEVQQVCEGRIPTFDMNFNPSRFANGVADACKFPQYYMPFGTGPRVCLGQNLAMVDLKIIMSLLVTNFSFSLSHNYVHSPSC